MDYRIIDFLVRGFMSIVWIVSVVLIIKAWRDIKRSDEAYRNYKIYREILETISIGDDKTLKDVDLHNLRRTYFNLIKATNYLQRYASKEDLTNDEKERVCEFMERIVNLTLDLKFKVIDPYEKDTVNKD